VSLAARIPGMVAKRLSGLVALTLALAGIGHSSTASAFTIPARTSTSVSCITDREGRGCGTDPIVDGSAFAFSPDGKNAYYVWPELPDPRHPELSMNKGGIWIYDRDPASGSLTQKPGRAGCTTEGRVKGCERGRALLYAFSIEVSPDGRNVYTASDEGSVAIFDRDPHSGGLSQKTGVGGVEGCITSNRKRYPTCAPGRGLESAHEVAVSPDGLNVYVIADRSLAVFDRDPSTGTLTQKPGTGGTLRGGAGDTVVVSPDGRNVYTSSGARVTTFDRDPNTGALTRVVGRAGCVSEKGKGNCRRGSRDFWISQLAISPDGRNVYGVAGEHKSGLLEILDRRPDGTLVQKPGRAGCFESSEYRVKGCTASEELFEAGDVTVAADGKHVYVFGYDTAVFVRHPSGRLTEAPDR
jgi:DNA-binding beta-propeller fold protein YncE